MTRPEGAHLHMNMMRTHRTRGSRKSIGVIPRAPTRARMSPEVAAALKSAWPSQAVRFNAWSNAERWLTKEGDQSSNERREKDVCDSHKRALEPVLEAPDARLQVIQF